MKFREAIKLARKHPGSTVKRGSDGQFIVVNIDVNTMNKDELKILKNELDNANQNIRKNKRKLQNAEKSTKKYRRELENAKESETKNKKLINTLQSKLNELDHKVIEYENKLSRLREEDWDIIIERELEERKNKLDQHKRIRCTCFGEVENCHICYGIGYYEVDGFGNKI